MEDMGSDLRIGDRVRVVGCPLTLRLPVATGTIYDIWEGDQIIVQMDVPAISVIPGRGTSMLPRIREHPDNLQKI